MEQRRLGPLTVSAIGLGCYGLSGAYGPVEPRRFQRTIRRAHDLGVTLFDTADRYGAAEETLGEALRPVRHQVVIATKGGLVGGEGRADTSPAHLRAACEASLRRLGTDVIDLYHVHFDDPGVPVADSAEALEALRREGKVRAWGVSHLPRERVEGYLRTGRCQSVMLELHPLAGDGYKDLARLAGEHGAGLVGFSVTARGLLAGAIGPETTFAHSDIRAIDPLFHPAGRARARRVVGRLAELAGAYGKTPVQVAIAWALARPGVAAVLVGSTAVAHLEENLGGAGWQLDPADLEALDAWLAEESEQAAREKRRTIAGILEAEPASPPRGLADLVYALEGLVEGEWMTQAGALPLFQRLMRARRESGPEAGALLREVHAALQPFVPALTASEG